MPPPLTFVVSLSSYAAIVPMTRYCAPVNWPIGNAEDARDALVTLRAVVSLRTDLALHALRASVTSVADEHDGSIIELRLSNAGQACVLPEGWPTVRLDEAGGGSQVAKIFPDTAAVQAGRKLLTTYQHGSTQTTALTLSRGGSVSVALFATATGPRACQRVTSLVVYPTTAARGAGRGSALGTRKHRGAAA